MPVCPVKRLVSWESQKQTNTSVNRDPFPEDVM